MSNPPESGPRGGLSLYANLLDPDAQTVPGTISKGPVTFTPAQTSNEPKKPQIDPAALRFQPTKRPQLSQKLKPKASFPKHINEPVAPGKINQPVANLSSLSKPTQVFKTSLADWTGDKDDDTFYGGEKRQRGGRKKKKKNREDYTIIQEWDDIYDPTRPNNFEEYKNSDERIREVREWKDRLYAHREAQKDQSYQNEEEDNRQPTKMIFHAPPSTYDFAPPPIETVSDPTSAILPDTEIIEAPVPIIAEEQTQDTRHSVKPPGQISRPPIRYQLPPAPSEIPATEIELEKAISEEQQESEDIKDPKSRRPGQKGFAERLMSKYGWSKGKGLGVEESGIVNPLQVKLEKRKKKSDAEGGGFRDTGGRVIVLEGMVDGMNLDEEVEGAGDGGLMQEIGDECADKYGRVERVYIHRSDATAKVFVKFTSQLSALRAVNALEGRIFNGNTIAAQFYDAECFEAGDFQ
ncbi:G-patch DNA repair protein [Blumeria hordei DH14]|uniref:G-patch DNA repair protein n=1 Tax=Blumeria graminis f. sp. hordei (strain DH14) TaxID=546991 RepID=N1JH17_BLUG1|nr:G-patch DNA repair protein [Blumeria hordei DH14]